METVTEGLNHSVHYGSACHGADQRLPVRRSRRRLDRGAGQQLRYRYRYRRTRSGRSNSFTGPGNKDVDFRIGRAFHIRERYGFAIVGEAFNLFNFTNIYTVNTTDYNYSAAGSGVCAGHTNGCLVGKSRFLCAADV